MIVTHAAPLALVQEQPSCVETVTSPAPPFTANAGTVAPSVNVQTASVARSGVSAGFAAAFPRAGLRPRSRARAQTMLVREYFEPIAVLRFGYAVPTAAQRAGAELQHAGRRSAMAVPDHECRAKSRSEGCWPGSFRHDARGGKRASRCTAASRRLGPSAPAARRTSRSERACGRGARCHQDATRAS